MIDLSEEHFGTMLKRAIDAIPEKYAKRLDNVAFVIADVPSPEQRIKLQLHPGQSLYGLYEGVPLTRRGSGYNLVLPDKITLFRIPMLATSVTLEDVQEQLNKTVWHEVAHYFGLNHEQIHKLEQK